MSGGAAAGILLVDKPAGATSAAVVDWVRWTLRTGVGHCGTLDPAATGLLVVVVGAATRLATLLTAQDKTYRAAFELGRSTTTADAQGQTTAQADVDPTVLPRAAQVVAAWSGTMMLSPPAYSAIKIDGQRAHALARGGEALELEPRPMTVLQVRDVEIRPPRKIEATMRLSKGSYVRSLAEELGRAVGIPAHLCSLRRLGSGTLQLDDPRTMAGLHVQPLAAGKSGKPRVRIRSTEAPADRASQAEAIARHLVSLRDAAPPPRWLTRRDAAGVRILDALLQGRPVPSDDEGWSVPPGAEVTRGVVMPEEAEPGLFIARHLPEERIVRSDRMVEPPREPRS